MVELRCKKCHNLLMKESIREGEAEIKCPKCNTFNIIGRKVLDKRERLRYSKSTWQRYAKFK